MNSMINFTNEIYRFLGTVTISDPYMALYHKQRVEAIIGEEISDRQNPYYRNLMGEYYINDDYLILSDDYIFVKSIDGFSVVYPNNGSDTGTPLDISKKSIHTTVALFNEASVGDTMATPLDSVLIIEYVSPHLVIVDKIPSDMLSNDGNNIPISIVITLTHSSSIILKQDNLDLHVKTKAYYQYNLTALTELTAKHPTKVDLIKNILFPVSIVDVLDSNSQEYIDAVDSKKLVFDSNIFSGSKDSILNLGRFSLLTYSDKHLEEGELTSIISTIQDFLRLYAERWDIPEYIEFEKYTHVVFWSMLWSILPMVIVKQRVANIHTADVHSDLIWAYLSSKGLDDYRDILSREQQLFLYKNIRYLLHTKGTLNTLKILAKELLVPYNIKLVSNVMTQSTSDSGITCLPTSIAVSKDIGSSYLPINEAGSREESFKSLYAHEVEDGLEPDFGPDLFESQALKLARANISKLPTKLIEFVSNSIHFYLGLEFIRYSIENLFYLYSESKLSYNATIKEDVIVGGVILTMEQSILLLVYALGQAKLTSAHISDENKDWFVDKIVIYDERRVTITDVNKDEYIGAFVELVGPIDIPTKFNIARPFKLNVTNASIDTTKLIDGIAVDIVDILDDPVLGATPADLPDRELTANGLIDKDIFLDYLTDTFAVRNADIEHVRGNGSKLYHRAFDILYDQLIERSELTIDFITDTGYATYEEWFADDTTIDNIIAQIDARRDTEEGYLELAEELLVAIMPIMESDYVKFGELSSAENKLMRRLFIQMCSYDIAFFETGNLISGYHYFSPIVHDDSVAYTQIIPMFVSPAANMIEADYTDTQTSHAVAYVPPDVDPVEPIVNQGTTDFLLQYYPTDKINRDYGGIIEARLDHEFGENVNTSTDLITGNFSPTETEPVVVTQNIYGVYYAENSEVGNPDGTDEEDAALWIIPLFETTASFIAYTGLLPDVYPIAIGGGGSGEVVCWDIEIPDGFGYYYYSYTCSYLS